MLEEEVVVVPGPLPDDCVGLVPNLGWAFENGEDPFPLIDAAVWEEGF